MSTVVIKIDGVDEAADVLYQHTRFAAAARGVPGQCLIRVRDIDQTKEFITGQTVELLIDGQPEWTGYSTVVRRGFFTMSDKAPGTVTRYFDISGVDLNILFQKRILYDKVNPEKGALTAFPFDTPDDEILLAYMTDHLDLEDDDLGTSLIEHVGTPANDSDIIGSAGWTWGDLMQFLTRNTGAIYYIDPERNVVLTDVDTPNAPFGISDSPQAGGAATGAFADDKEGSSPLVDPRQGMTTIACNPAGFTADPTDPTEFENWGDGTGSYSAWLKMVLTESATLRMDTYGSSMVDTILMIFAQEDPPGASSTPSDISDDTAEPPYSGSSHADEWHSLLPDGGGGYAADGSSTVYPAGTYWICVFPWEGSGWDTGEGGFVLNILREDGYPAPLLSEVGARDLEIDFGGEAMKNDVMAWGIGQGSNSPVFSRVESLESIEAHGRWQAALMAQSVWRQATITRTAISHVFGSPQNQRGGKDDAVAVRCVVRDPGLRVGMKVPVRANSFGFEDVLPVRASEITFLTPTSPRWTLTLTHEIDDPWSTYEFWMPNYEYPRWPPIGVPGLPNIPGIGPLPPLSLPTLPPFDPCATLPGDYCLIDNFFRAVDPGWGEADTGQEWEYSVFDPSGTFFNYTRVEGNWGKVVWGDPGALTEPVGAQARASQTITGLNCGRPVEIYYDLLFDNATDNTILWNQAQDGGGTPRTSGGRPIGFGPGQTGLVGLNTGWNYHKLFHTIGFGDSESGAYFRIYQYGGGIYIAEMADDDPLITGSETPFQYAPVFACAQPSPVWVRVRVRVSPGQVSIAAWPFTDAIPEDDLITKSIDVVPAELTISYDGVHRKGVGLPANGMWVGGITVRGSTTIGEAMGLFGVGREDDFERDTTNGWGTGGLGTWQIGSTTANISRLFTADGDGRYSKLTGGGNVEASLYIAVDGSFPKEYLIEFRHTWSISGGWGGNLQGNQLRLTGALETPSDRLNARLDNGPAVNSSSAKVRRGVDIDNTAFDSDSPVTAWLTYSSGQKIWWRVRYEKNGDDYTVRSFAWLDGNAEDTVGRSVTATKVGWVPNQLEWFLKFPSTGPFGTPSTEVISIEQITEVGLPNPCEGAEPGELADPPRSGDTCNELESVATPGGEDPTSAYFIIPHVFVNGSEKVYLNGSFLRPGVDYVTHPADRLVEIFSATTVDPGDVIYACYDFNLPVEVE